MRELVVIGRTEPPMQQCIGGSVRFVETLCTTTNTERLFEIQAPVDFLSLCLRTEKYIVQAKS